MLLESPESLNIAADLGYNSSAPNVDFARRSIAPQWFALVWYGLEAGNGASRFGVKGARRHGYKSCASLFYDSLYQWNFGVDNETARFHCVGGDEDKCNVGSLNMPTDFLVPNCAWL